MSQKDLKRRTKIVCTIGPVSIAPAVLAGLMKEDMNVARINFSHGSARDHVAYIKKIREMAAQLNKTVAIMQDLPGPKDRIGRVKKGGIQLTAGQTYTITTMEVIGDEQRVSVEWAELPLMVKKGMPIFIDDGTIKLEVMSAAKTDIKCRVITGGRLMDNKGINVPGVAVASSITPEDIAHLELGIRNKVDFVAVSFISRASDILAVKKILDKYHSHAMLIAKIERQEALDNLDEIIKVADGIMVARGDLGVEIPIEKVPVAQKTIIRKCNRAGKPVIVATQMLESMVESPRPTRAEVTDVANAIYDGADAVMMSEETAVGKYPLEAVKVMSNVALEVESVLPYEEILILQEKDQKKATDDAISYSACHVAQQLDAKAIVAFTSSGSTARRVSKYRPEVPILAITASALTRRQLCLSWGVNAYRVHSATRVSELFSQAVGVAHQSGSAKKDDLIVITGGIPVGVSGSTNMLKVQRV
jgi:pyruvate kinase